MYERFYQILHEPAQERNINFSVTITINICIYIIFNKYCNLKVWIIINVVFIQYFRLFQAFILFI